MLDTSRLTNTPRKAILYDPMKPERSVVWDGLPCSIRFDKVMGQFSTDPLHYALLLLAATFVCGAIIAIIVLAIRAI